MVILSAEQHFCATSVRSFVVRGWATVMPSRSL
jgi:hypothetical protein